MNYYRITKYNPEYRDENGFYKRNDWTSISDTWVIENRIHTPSIEYIALENEYVDSIVYIMNINNIRKLKIERLELGHAYIYSDLELYYTNFKNIENNQWIQGENLKSIIKLCLRQNIWCVLNSGENFVHFSDEMYVFVGFEIPIDFSEFKKIFKNIYIENFKSPILLWE